MLISPILVTSKLLPIRPKNTDEKKKKKLKAVAKLSALHASAKTFAVANLFGLHSNTISKATTVKGGFKNKYLKNMSGKNKINY